MKVRCIEEVKGSLTLNKTYEVVENRHPMISVVNDLGIVNFYLYDRFIEVKEDTKTPTNPTHYHTKIQPIEFIEANNLGFHEGNVIKYITRYKDKNGIEDLEKAKTYIEMLIDKLKRENA